MSSLNTARPVLRGDAAAAKAIVTVLIALCGALALDIIVSSGDCSAWFAIRGICGSSMALPLALGLAALPLMVFAVGRHPFAAVLGLYIVLVPMDDALLIGQSFTITKLVGFALAVLALARIARRGPQLSVPRAVVGWIAALSFMAVSITWSIDTGLSMSNLITIFSEFFLLVVVVATPMEEMDYRSIIWATVLSGAVVGIVALVFSRHELSTSQGQTGRLYLTLWSFAIGKATIDPNRFAASLLLPVAMSVGALVHARSWYRVGFFIALALTITAIYLSASRGAMLALVAMAVVGILATKRRLLFGSLLAATVGLVLAIPNEISSRVFKDTTTVTGAGRVDIWKVALEIFRGHWLVGTGAGTFESAYNQAFFLAYQPRSAFGQWAAWGRDPHSLLLSTASELGVIGIVLMAVALVLQYRSTRLIGPDHAYPWLRTVFAAAFVGLLLDAFFVDVLSTKFVWLLFMEMLLFARAATPAALPARAQAVPP